MNVSAGPRNKSVIMQIQQALGIHWNINGQMSFSFDQPIITMQEGTVTVAGNNTDEDAPANEKQDGGPTVTG